MAIAPNLGGDDENRDVRDVFGDKDRLYFVLNIDIDQDLLPQPSDFSIIYDSKTINILNIDSQLEGNGAVIVFSLDQEVESGKSLILSYKPTDWFMCDGESGDSVESFEDPFTIKPLEQLTGRVLPPSEPVERKTNAIDAYAKIGFINTTDLQISVETQLDITIAPQKNDFVVEQDGRTFQIEELSYVKGRFGPDIHITLKLPLAAGKKTLVSYTSSEGHLKTVDANAIADFSLSTAIIETARSSGGMRAEIKEKVSSEDVWAKLDAALAHDEANDSEIDPTRQESERVDIDLEIESHDVDEELHEVDALFEQFEEEAQVARTDGPSKGKVSKKTVDKVVEKTPRELSTLFRLVEESEEADPDDLIEEITLVGDPYEADAIIESADLIDEIASEKAYTDADDALSEKIIVDHVREDVVDSHDWDGIVDSDEQASDTDTDTDTEPATQTKTKAPMTLATKLIYLVPIIVFAWLFIVICIYLATIVFDFDLSFSSGGVPQNQQEGSLEQQKPVEEVKRESCRLESPDGGVYEGHCLNGMRDGHGLYTWASGNRYVGEWSRDRQNGKGTLILTTGAVYEGEFRAGLEHGQGKMTWPNGAWYEGLYEKGKFHGAGVYVSSEGNRYEGVFKNGSMTKNGTCAMNDGRSYFGPCKSGPAAPAVAPD